jgi:hypothetical protein
MYPEKINSVLLDSTLIGGETTKLTIWKLVLLFLAFAAFVLPWFAVTMTAPYNEQQTILNYSVLHLTS